MHKLRQLIRDINRTHKGLGLMIAMEILTAKAKKTLLKISPAGCGKSVASDAVSSILAGRNKKYTSLTLAGLQRLKDEFTSYDGHVIVDDLGAEKSTWSRTSTVTVLANLVYVHWVHKITQGYEINLTDFRGSVSLNIQPVLLNTLVQTDDWVAVVRDKVIRYYHLNRPSMPKNYPPRVRIDWGLGLDAIKMSKYRGKLWYQLVAITLCQWSYARVIEHLPDLLKACAALDGREEVNVTDYHLLIAMLQPMQLEPYLVESYGFESGRVFNNNLYCILVELTSFGHPSVEQICYDYKVSRTTADRLIESEKQYCFWKTNGTRRLYPTDRTKELLDLAGVDKKW